MKFTHEKYQIDPRNRVLENKLPHPKASALKMVGMGVRRALIQPINLEKKFLVRTLFRDGQKYVENNFKISKYFNKIFLLLILLSC